MANKINIPLKTKAEVLQKVTKKARHYYEVAVEKHEVNEANSTLDELDNL